MSWEAAWCNTNMKSGNSLAPCDTVTTAEINKLIASQDAYLCIVLDPVLTLLILVNSFDSTRRIFDLSHI